jgi:hypothetical protein
MAFSLTALRGLKCALVTWFLFGAASVRAEDFALATTSVRIGLPAQKINFYETDVLVGWTLPWVWHFDTNWRLDSRLDLTAGWLSDGYVNGAIMTVGPSFGLHRTGVPLALEAGVSPTALTRHEFERKDFGSYFQFTSHVGLSWQFLAHYSVGYQFQHMSNSGISNHNPGVNLNVIEVRYIF